MKIIGFIILILVSPLAVYVVARLVSFAWFKTKYQFKGGMDGKEKEKEV